MLARAQRVLAGALRAGKNGVRALLLRCSDGSTSDFAKSGGSASIIANGSWEEDIEARRLAEGRHRGLLLQTACALLQFDWMLCFDADERVAGDLRGLLQGPRTGDCEGIRVRLFDAYMTPDDCAPYQSHLELLGFRQFFGPEQRDILMLWRNREKVFFAERHAREPGGIKQLRTELYCQHYGKSLSVEHWEETCDYYIRHFPFETYGRKWLDRKGQAIGTGPISSGRCTNGVKPCLRMR